MSVLVLVLVFAVASGASASGSPSTCADLATNDTYGLSFEGSWSYRTLDPQHAPLSTGEVERNERVSTTTNKILIVHRHVWSKWPIDILMFF